MRLFVALLMGLYASAAFAQASRSPPPSATQTAPPDPQLTFCQKAVNAIQNQRNMAQDGEARCAVQTELVNDELSKAHAEAADLRKQSDAAKAETDELKKKSEIAKDELSKAHAEAADLKKKLAPSAPAATPTPPAPATPAQ
jgi:hypothetical protein